MKFKVEDRLKAPLFVVIAGACWGIIGIFTMSCNSNMFDYIFRHYR